MQSKMQRETRAAFRQQALTTLSDPDAGRLLKRAAHRVLRSIELSEHAVSAPSRQTGSTSSCQILAQRTVTARLPGRK